MHIARERWQRLPSLRYKLSNSLSADLKEYVKELNKEGMVKIEGFIDENDLKVLQSDFHKMVEEINKKSKGLKIDADGYIEEAYKPDYKITTSNNPFKYSSKLAEACINPRIYQMINAYMGKRTHLHQAVGNRMLPYEIGKVGSYQWHHDAWGKRVNMMILLSDIEEGDQYMTYIKKSHKIRHAYKRYMNSRIEVEYCESRMKKVEIAKAVGRAGDIYLFDPNGLHSANRTMGKIRDTFIMNYSADHTYVWAFDLPADFVKGHSKEQLLPFQKAIERATTGSGLLPEYRSWIETLPNIRSWLS